MGDLEFPTSPGHVRLNSIVKVERSFELSRLTGGTLDKGSNPIASAIFGTDKALIIQGFVVSGRLKNFLLERSVP